MLKRRTLLVTGAGAAAVAATGVVALSSRANRQRLKNFVADVAPEPELDRQAPTGSLSAAEARTIVALAEILYPPQPGLAVDAFVRAHAAHRCEAQPGYLAQYGGAARLLDARAAATRAGASFADLAPAARDEILRGLLWSYSGRRFVGTLGRWAENATVSSEALALRRFVVSDLLQAYYSSPQGWAVVGYTHFPGVPAADPRDYTRPLAS